MKNVFLTTIAASALFVASTVSAAQYAVQVGAHKFYKKDNFQSASQHGALHTDKNKDVTKVHVGYFNSKAEAAGLLKELKQAGYEDAFIAEIAGSNATADIKTTDRGDQYQAAKATVKSEETVVQELDAERRQSLSQLSSEEFSKAVYVDGVLMIRDNKQLMTLDQYRKAQ